MRMFAAVVLKLGMFSGTDRIAQRMLWIEFFRVFVIGILFAHVYNKLLMRFGILAL